jgi:hypothetical protein
MTLFLVLALTFTGAARAENKTKIISKDDKIA